jgi:hypothetical protein
VHQQCTPQMVACQVVAQGIAAAVGLCLQQSCTAALAVLFIPHGTKAVLPDTSKH